MKNALALLMLFTLPGRAELLQVDLRILGMD
jgi:hypothetical protein